MPLHCRIAIPVFILSILSPSAHSQSTNPFFVPPTYPGTGRAVAADFNKDGKLDLAFTDGTLLLGRGDGTFTTASTLTVTGDTIVAGDFNGDGKPDIAIASDSSTLLSVLLGNGDGTFQAALTTTVGAALKSLVVADFNGDHKLDVAGVNDSSGLFVLLGAGNGSFAPASGSPRTLPPSSVIVAGDFNGDSNVDLAYGSSSNSSAGIPGGVFLGNGDGTFKTGSALTIGLQGVLAAGAGDVNGDGKLDLIFSGSTGGSVAATVVFLGNGDGTFQLIDSSLAANGAIALADLNRDHRDDIILDDGIGVRVFLSGSDGTALLANAYSPVASQDSSSVIAADFNGDGTIDVAARNVMLLGNGDGSLQGNDVVLFTKEVTPGAIGDFNSDGSQDLATADGSSLIVFLNDGSGKFIQAHSYPGSMNPFAAVDMNRDGKLDLLLFTTDNSSGAQTFGLGVMFGNGDGTFGALTSTGITGLTALTSINVIDLNGDQVPDLIGITPQGVSVFLGKADGTFSSAVNYSAGATPTYLLTGDFNNDGKADAAVQSSVESSAGIGVLLGKGDGTFAPVIFSNPGIFPDFAAAGDVNRDGKLDLVVADSDVAVYLGNGDGTFQAPYRSGGGPMPDDGFSLPQTLTDFTGDGKLDLIAGPGLFLAQGNGDGTFMPFNQIYSGTHLYGPNVRAVADLNGDGRPDALLLYNEQVSPEWVFETLLNVTGASIPNFTVTAPALTPQSVEPGGTFTTTVTVTPANGFTANVALSCVGLPLNSTCNFAPAPTGPSSTSTVTIAIPSTSATGAYYASVVGKGGGLTHSRLLGLIVTGPPDFAVSAGSGGSATVVAGQTATYPLSLAGSNGFNGSVGLSCSGAPAETACSISPTSVALNETTPVTATVSVTTTARSFVMGPSVERPLNGHWRMLIVPGISATFAALLALIFFGLRSRGSHRFGWVPLVTVSMLLLIAGIAMSACGGGGGSNGGGTGTAAGNYTITITATTGSGASAVSHTTKLTLIVQ
jgi:hypothetical protein